MAFNNRWKAELGISALIFVEFAGVTIWATLTERNDIVISSAVLMVIGLLFTLFKLFEVKFQEKMVDDERIEKLTEQAYLISAIAGIMMLTQLAIWEILTGTTISTLETFFIVTNTVLLVFIFVNFLQHFVLT
jgi:hypothetical protein